MVVARELDQAVLAARELDWVVGVQRRQVAVVPTEVEGCRSEDYSQCGAQVEWHTDPLETGLRLRSLAG